MGGEATVYSSSSYGSGHGIKGASAIRGFVNKIGAVHTETYWGYQELATYSAAWFKVFLDKTPQENSVDYESMIFGNETSSLCHGGDGAMEECTVHDGVPT